MEGLKACLLSKFASLSSRPDDREMAFGDLAELERVLAASPGASRWSAADLLSLVSRNTRIWVAEEDGKAAGIVAVRTAADEAEILNLAVAPAWRRRGLGRALMGSAIAESARMGAARVFLEVRESNAAARAFYASLGFLPSGRRTAYYHNPVEDALVLTRLVG